MVRRNVHYEAAFESYLRSAGVAHLAIDETHRAAFGVARIKSFALLIYPPDGKNQIVDIKGRQFPYRRGRTRRYWENWVTREDLDDLRQWQEVFGDGFTSAFVCAYWLTEPQPDGPIEPDCVYRDEVYAFRVCPLAEYEAHARPRSPKWATLAVSASTCRRIARPVGTLW